MSNKCDQCGSYAINHHSHGRDGSEPDLCDVCFWRNRHDQLKAKLDDVAKDAARYRWMREQTWDKARICVVTNPKESVRLGYDCPSTDRLDAAIDAAMAGGGE